MFKRITTFRARISFVTFGYVSFQRLIKRDYIFEFGPIESQYFPQNKRGIPGTIETLRKHDDLQFGDKKMPVAPRQTGDDFHHHNPPEDVAILNGAHLGVKASLSNGSSPLFAASGVWVISSKIAVSWF